MTELAVALVAQGAILALVLCVMESRQPAANRFLAGLLAAISARLLAQLLVSHMNKGHQLLIALHNTTFLIGPLLFFYTRALVERPLRLRTRQLWHLLPALLATLWSLSGLAGYERDPSDSAVVRISAVHGLFGNLSIVVYCVATLGRLVRYQRDLLDHYSAIERISLNWLKTLIWIVLAGGCALALVNLLRLMGGWALDPTWVVTPLSIALFYAVAILGFRQSTVLLIGIDRGAKFESPATTQTLPPESPPVPGSDSEESESEEPDSEEPAPAAQPEEKYRRSGLDEERAGQLWLKLEALMRDEALYLEPDLQLATLAQRLQSSPQILSEVLGKMAGVRFYDYINRLRVARARELLADAEQGGRPILDIAFAAGFNTKSSFNKYFKQELGITPSEYRKQAQAGRGL